MRRELWITIGSGISLLAGVIAWVAVERLESRNSFCVSCHLEPRIPLHREISENFNGRPPVNLAAAHLVAEAEFRCIECHGGTGFVGRLRVKLVSARDTLMYLTGRFQEPDRMTAPLWDEDCSKCHEIYRVERPDAFHAIVQHNVRLAYRCVECHQSHPVAPADLQFLNREVVLPICRECQKEF